MHRRAVGRGKIGSEVTGTEARPRRIERPHNAPENGPDPPCDRGDGRVRGRVTEAGDDETDDEDGNDENETETAMPHLASHERDEHDSGKARGSTTNLPRPDDTVEENAPTSAFTSIRSTYGGNDPT
jgi:hypothetical protein